MDKRQRTEATKDFGLKDEKRGLWGAKRVSTASPLSSVVCPLLLALAASLAPSAQAGEIITKPWLQNIYTNRVTVMCETLGEMPGLSVVVQGVKEEGRDSFEMVPTNGLKEGTFVYQAQISLKPGKHPTYELVTNGVAIPGTSGSVMAWQDEDAAFSCAIWGDNQEGVQKYDWGNDVASERYRCITNMFVHMAAQKPDFGFSTGDFSSDALYDEEIEPGELRGADDLFGRTIPYHLVWGNHDCIGTFLGEVYTNAAQRYFSPAATEEEGVFALYRNDVLFIGVHWTWGKDDAEVRYDEITNKVTQILATDRAKNAKFRVLVQHAPIFLECYNVLPKVNWFSDTRLLDVAKAGGVDLVFSGHTHAYERIERDGLVQIVNGGMGYLDHGERWYNNYGSDTKVGGHQNTPLLWARQSSSSLFPGSSSLAPAQPVRMGCFQGYGILSVTNSTLTYKAHAFNADGSYIGVADAFSIESKTHQEVKAGGQGQEWNVKSIVNLNLQPQPDSPVNNATWAAFKQSQGESWEKPAGAADTDPVVNVSKTEIERFCAALNAGKSTNYRLPTVKELTAIFAGNLKRDVSEWTADVDPNSGWCRILGGNEVAVDYTWCREYDKPAMSAPDCHANYLGFRVIDAPVPEVVPSAMDQALAKLAEKVAAGEPIAEVYVWKKPSFIEPYALVDITDDWTNGTIKTTYDYTEPVIFTGTGALEYGDIKNEIIFGGGLAAPNATSLDLSKKPGDNLVTIKGEFRGGLAADEWRFMLRCDELTLENVKYRGQVFNAVTDDRKLKLVGTNDFSGAVMSLCVDKVLADPQEDFVTNLVAKKEAMLWLRRLDFSARGVVEEVLGQKTAGFTVGENVTLVTTEDVLFAIKGATLTVDGTLDAAGIDIAGHLLGLLPQEASLLGSGTVRTTHFGMCDKSTLNLGVRDTTLLSSVPYRTYSDPESGCNVKWIQRDPDYADETGKDWLFNHDIAAKRYEGEPVQDPGVDLFYFYPTSVNVSDDHCVDGVCDIDDEYLRSEKGALSSWNMTGKVFGDFTHVYAPYYRQTPSDVELQQIDWEHPSESYDKMTKYWYDRAPYGDVTNALTHYFTKINPKGKRPFVLAGHSHGAGMLILAMEHFFKDHPEWLEKMVACYAIGMGVSDKWEEAVKDYAPIATNATDAGVYVFWNTEGPNTSEGMQSALWPTNHVAGVNPITWTRDAGSFAPASLNLGGFTADDTGAVRPGLYDASNNVAHGTVVCSSSDLADKYLATFGEKSLHGWDYKIYWENLRANTLQRIKTRNAKLGRPDYAQIPLAGTPIDYADPYNWVTNTGSSKPLDVFYVYPTMMLEGDSTIVPVTDAMKAKAYTNAYLEAASAFAGYANVLVPAYRQVHGGAVGVAQTLYPEPRDFIDFYKGETPRTDLFAALDYYFTNLNAGVQRPFILAGHSQGSCMLKIAFEDYFRSNDTRKGYLNKMVAAYPLGYSFAQKWFDSFYEDKALGFATNATDTGVLVSWNTEGTNATQRSFVIENGALVINPMNWTTNVNVWSETVPDAMIQERTATDCDYTPGTYALVTTNATDYLPSGSGFGEKSLHGKDWTLWYEQIKANGFTRYGAFVGLAEVKTNQFVQVADATLEVKVQGQGQEWTEATLSPVDGKYYAPADAAAVQVVYTLDATKAAEGYRFANGETSISFPMEQEGGVWVSTLTPDQIKAATKTGLPTLKLGVVAQRYPWNGTVDVGYKATYWPAGKKAAVEVTVGESVTTNDLAITGQGTVTGAAPVDLKAMAGEVKGEAKFKAVVK